MEGPELEAEGVTHGLLEKNASRKPQARNGACLWASFHKEDIHRLQVTIQHGQSDRVHQKTRCKTCNQKDTDAKA